MRVVLFCGGLGLRMGEESARTPKPMVRVGAQPILWHIMKYYAHFGHRDFIICLGYKGYLIKEYFANYFLHQSDVTFDFRTNRTTVHQNSAEPWSVTVGGEHCSVFESARLKVTFGFSCLQFSRRVST